MRFVLNTNRYDAGSRVCIYELHKRLVSHGEDATLNDWSHYEQYDFVVFMGYDHEIRKAKKDNPRIKVILADPKLTSKEQISAAESADLLIVSSIEQRDAFLELNPNIHIHYMFPMTKSVNAQSGEKDIIRIGYHGNRVHLDAMHRTVLPAFAELSKRHTLEFVCIYDKKRLGISEMSRYETPRLRISHHQWEEDTLIDKLCLCDVGVLPNELPLADYGKALKETALNIGDYAYEPFDHLVRYKVSTNPGRLYPYACARVPVIADFCPSASQFIKDGESGFIASSVYGWYYALESLSESSELRRRCADGLYKRVASEYNRQVASFLNTCKELKSRTVIRINSERQSVREAQVEYNRYRRPQETLLRWSRRHWRRLFRL